MDTGGSLGDQNADKNADSEVQAHENSDRNEDFVRKWNRECMHYILGKNCLPHVYGLNKGLRLRVIG